MNIRHRLWWGALALALGAGAGVAQAADYPDRTLRAIVPSPAGSAPDIITRLLAERMSRALGQSIVTENKPGGNGIIAMNELRRAKPDGYTFGVFHAAAAVVTPMMYKAADFDVQKDTDVVATIAYTPMLVVANTSTPYKSLEDVVQAAQAKPDDLVFGNPVHGSVPHLTAERIGQIRKAVFRQISFNGTSQAIQSTIGGDAQVYVDGVAPLLPLVQSGRLRALAVTADKELPGLEGIPLAKNTVPELVSTGWFVMLTPAGTPPEVTQRLHEEATKALAEPDMVERLKDLGTYPMPTSMADAQTFISNEKQIWRKVIDDAGVKPE
ncbi:tripartite tricarboxylate transporter substrate binding protein [Verticiella sediminum]|uniref:Tripartite tricarboxylate transporter substrate binding protein n=1 Tax=Verticiella sediminum TaxID=1247510 RepID=A0A556AWQ5_9BURK|nr:tripartite tricarboxylate transporter substrate binding protein [Verticiella sediminum]TSH97346.1 tripartite tricarboxylate transporter substrate binding protein [Verticiella sediminum]